MRQPELGGGALFDIGVYTINFADFIFDAEPQSVLANGMLTELGVDSDVSSVSLNTPGSYISANHGFTREIEHHWVGNQGICCV